jgi:hypothetical protein
VIRLARQLAEPPNPKQTDCLARRSRGLGTVKNVTHLLSRYVSETVSRSVRPKWLPNWASA